MTTSAPDVYVSRLLTDRPMLLLRESGVLVNAAAESPPSRAELEAGICGAAAAIITLTERIDAEVLQAAGA